MDDVTAFVADLEAALGPGQARAEPLELALYQRDAGVDRGAAAAVCFPTRGADVAAAVRVAARHGRSFVARGSGTGLAGGATPVGDPLVIVTTRLARILEVNAEDQYAWVEPGVLNLDLSRAVHHLGLHYAPDPSSQQACTIGGNVATNAGGPCAPRRGSAARACPARGPLLARGSRRCRAAAALAAAGAGVRWERAAPARRLALVALSAGVRALAPNADFRPFQRSARSAS